MPTSAATTGAASGARDWARLEDLVGGRALAWVGGLALVVGIVLLLALAVRYGWLGEGARTALAAVVSVGLVATGARIRASRTDAALAAVAAGSAGLFATIVVATQHYGLVPAPIGLVAAAATAAVATAFAIRWAAPGIGALGLGGALLAPVLTGASAEGGGLLFLVIAAGAAVVVLAHQRWTWLAALSFACATPQWISALQYEPAPVVLGVAAGFGLLNALGAVGYEIRRSPRDLRLGAQALVALNAFVVAVAGVELGDLTEPAPWLATLAAAHLVAAAGLGSSRRASRELTLTLAALGVALADAAFATVADGLPLVAGWASTAVAFAGLLRESGRPDGPLAALGVGRHAADGRFARVGLGGHLLLAMSAALVVRDADGAAMLPLLAAAAACAISGRIARDGHGPWRASLDVIAMLTLALVLVDALDGLALTVALALEAVAIAGAARLGAVRRHPVTASGDGAFEPDLVGAAGAVAFLASAAAHALMTSAPPAGLLDGVDPLGTAVAALLAVGVAATVVAERSGPLALLSGGVTPGAVAGGLRVTAVVSALYLGSLTVVSVSSPDAAQLALSAFWALSGVALLLVGLRMDERPVRAGALLLLAATGGKVFLYDLASLESIYRVLSFIALGVLLLAAAHAWQRLRPRTSGDGVSGPKRGAKLD